tara:strand:- start:178 stop:1119 length:942 start_codon:yes stop_codon:yes gene_type:complete
MSGLSVRILISRFLAILILMLFGVNPVASHNGDKDSRGGHIDNSDRFGSYHFHEGPLAGQAFLSEKLATNALDEYYRTAPAEDADGVIPLNDRELSVFFPESFNGELIIDHGDHFISNGKNDDKLKWVIYKMTKPIRVLGRTDKSSSMSASSKVSESYFLPNIFPQIDRFNLRIGRKLDLAVREYTRQHKSIIVVTGPIFYDVKPLNGARDDIITDTYFKVVLDISEPLIEGLAFVVSGEGSPGSEHETGSGEIEKFIVPIDEVEKLTGIDFFSGLDADLENEFEGHVNFNHWNIANKPSLVDLISWGKIKAN